MNPHYFFLALDIGSVLIPFFISFYPRTPFIREWRRVWPSILGPAIFFILWDMVFTGMGVWGFNPAYLTGPHLGNLPIEEILFFICIPYACLFTYYVLVRVFRHQWIIRTGSLSAYVLAGVSVLIALDHHSRLYTSTTFLLLATLLVSARLGFRAEYLGRFFMAYLVLLIPFLIVNGILTGTGIPDEIVWYNDEQNLGVRILTIPVEDIFYGMLLILMNVVAYEELGKRWKKSQA